MVGSFQEGPSVVDVHAHARVLVRMVRVQVASQPLQHGVDLHGVDVRRPFRQRQRHVVAAARSHDQDVTGAGRQMRVRVGVERLLGEQDRQGRHGLVRAVVHADRHPTVATRPRT